MAHTSRRRFAKSLAAAGAVLPLAAVAQTPPSAQTPPAVPPSAFAKALTELTRAQYGAHLNDEELTRIEKDFQDAAPSLERFRSFKLANGDEPDFTFHSLTDRW